MPRSFTRRDVLSRSAAAIASGALLRSGLADEKSSPATAPAGSPFRLYAMDTGLGGPDVPTLETKTDLLKRLGYAGIDYTLNHDQLPHLLELLDRRELELSCVYASPSLEDAVDPRWGESIKRMAGRKTRIELAIRSKKFKSSDSAGDPKGIDLLKHVSDLCGDSGPVVSVYPHTGVWTEKVDDGNRLAQQLDRKNVGTNFNLVHWSWVQQCCPLEEVLTTCLPRILTVTINGLDGRKIVTLDQGDYDVAGFLATLKKVGYRGQVGLQGYGIPGPSAENLKRSMQKWTEMTAKLG